MGRCTDAVEPMDERLEDLDRSPLERGPATREPSDEPSAAVRCHDEPDQDRDAHEVDGQHDERGYLEKPRHRDDEDSSAKMSTTTRLSRTRSTTSVASVVQKGWARAAALESGT